jgi:hypothetical protein
LCVGMLARDLAPDGRRAQAGMFAAITFGTMDQRECGEADEPGRIELSFSLDDWTRVHGACRGHRG